MGSYNPHELPERWLLGACSSGDPLRWVVVAVEQKVQRQAAELDAARARAATVIEAYRKVPLTVRAACGDELADALEALTAPPAAEQRGRPATSLHRHQGYCSTICRSCTICSMSTGQVARYVSGA